MGICVYKSLEELDTIEYVIAVAFLAGVILLLLNLKRSRRTASHTTKEHRHDYHGVYSHDSHSLDAEAYFPVLKDSASVFPMNKREEREKTETFQNEH
jgi:hypothetical protein